MAQETGKSREVRLGLVMYGGVSLAIYINGVAQEFFRAVRGRGVYRLIKALTDSDIVVDVISGTSAGGVNGIMLGYALCNGRDFAATTELWRMAGDIRKLLLPPRESPESAYALLDSEGYYQPNLEKAFRTMPPLAEADEDPSAVTELDLFVTGTDVDGAISTRFDDAGHPIDVKDHRAVFLLKHRRGRKEPFNPSFPPGPSPPEPETTYKALATLARITSSFPVAFAPTHVGNAAPGNCSVDAKLQLWGDLGKECYFLDGGVLDNKPFSYTVREIYYRLTDREVERRLFYVEPDPERFARPQGATRPNAFQAAIAALIGIPGYESIADDLQLIAERNSKVERYWRFASSIRARLAATLSPGGRELLERARRGEEGATWALPGALEGQTAWLHRRSRLVALSERVVRGVLRQAGRDPYMDKHREGEQEKRRAAAALYAGFDRWEDPDDEVLRCYDVDFRLRRLFHLVYLIYCQKLAFDGENAPAYRGLWRALNRQIKLLEIVKAAMEEMIDQAPVPWQGKEATAVWADVEAAFRTLLDTAGGPAAILPAGYSQGSSCTELETVLDQKGLSEVGDRLKARSETIVRAFDDGLELSPPEPFESLFALTDRCERTAIARLLPSQTPESAEPVLAAYDEFPLLDAYLYPIEVIADLHEKDIIETVRISPLDARTAFSDRPAADKVSGDALYHFGGFFKRSWRSNDILWGRLDGLCQLVESLLTPERVREVLATRRRPAELRDLVAGPLAPAVLFPKAGRPTQEELGRCLERLLSDDPDEREKALAPDEFGRFVRLLVEAAQFEVIGEDLPVVIRDAVEEQTEWNRYRSTPPGATKPPPGAPPAYDPARGIFYTSGEGDLDPLFLAVAADELAHAAVQRLTADDEPSPRRPMETRLGRFFTQHYRVGSEEFLRDIPPSALLETLSTALLDVRNTFLALLGPRAEKVKGTLVFKIINGGLTAFHGLTHMLRREPCWVVATLVALASLSLLALIISLIWWREMIPPGTLTWFVVFILLPLLVLGGVIFVFRRVGRRGGN